MALLGFTPMGVAGCPLRWRLRSKYTTRLLAAPCSPLDTVASSMAPVGAERAEMRSMLDRSMRGALTSMTCCMRRAKGWWAKRYLRTSITCSA